MTLESIMSNKQFQEKLYEAKDIIEVKALFVSEGYELTEDKLMSMLLPEGENLSEDELENVTGGGSIMSWIRSRLGGGKGAFGGGGSAGGR